MSKFSEWISRATNGFYNCRWKADGETQEPTSLCEKFWWWFLLIVFGFSLTWLYCWSVFSNDYNDFEFFVYENTGFWFAWALLILIVAWFLFIYALTMLVISICLIAKGQGRRMHACHKVFLFPVLAFCIAAYIAIDRLWNYEYRTVVIALQMMGPFIHIACLFVITLCSCLMLREIMKISGLRLRIFSVVGLSCFMLLTCLVPLAIDSPCFGDNLNSQSKPLLIAHRLGYVKTAPENTRLAYEQASSCGLFGLETDISISTDGVPFVMHDYSNMLRTTNVADVYPNRSSEKPEWFSWPELQQLDAGSWFLKEDPYLTVHTLSEDVKKEIKKQKILSLDEVAHMIGNHSLVFDLRQPSYGHPYRENFTEQTMQVLLKSGLPQNQVLWLPSVDRGKIREKAPGFIQVSAETSIEYLKTNNISMVNLQYNFESKRSIHLYAHNNITTIQYVMSSQWLFSAAWCQGTNVVMTGDCKEISRQSRPIWTLTKLEYAAVWVSLDLLALAVFIGFFVLQIKGSTQHNTVNADVIDNIDMSSETVRMFEHDIIS